ncbi:MAG TPA: dTDP-glucose 4,6-dehydratase [Candidatus Limnocylindria bacterium]|nr:dTDP-glucose 4,6-dehydratase [Candidatus Limnocylindria bacterium]
MRLLVTGAAGFIGSNFVRRVLGEPGGAVERLVAVDLLTYAGNLRNLGAALDDRRVRFERLDIADREAMAALVAAEHVDVVVNFAAETHVDRSIDDHGPFLRTNVHGVVALLDAVRDRPGFRRFLQVSTDEVYGSVATGRSTERAPLRPSSPYAASKAAADAFVTAYATTYGVPVTITRCCNNYGPYQFPEKLIPLFVTNALAERPLPLYGDGLQVRDWIHVDDHCDALWLLLGRSDAVGETFNVSAHDERTNRDVTALILRATGRPESLVRRVRDRPGHDRRYALDASRLHATGWRPRWRFEDGLAETVAWYARERDWVAAVQSGEYRAYYERMYGARLREAES